MTDDTHDVSPVTVPPTPLIRSPPRGPGIASI